MNVIENDTSGRSCFSDTISSAPLASVAFVQAGTCSSGALPGGGIFERSSACCADAGSAHSASDEDDGRQPSNDGLHRFTSGRGVSVRR